MRHPRPRSRRSLARAATAAVLGAAVLAGPSGAVAAASRWEPAARTWSVPTVLLEDATSSRDRDRLEDALMVRINDARAALGLRKIWNFDVCTDELAEQWGTRIARTGVFAHRDQGEVIRRCRHAWAGEALVRGTALTPDEMVRLWLDSPDHRAILLNPDARRAGVAITEDAQGRVVGVVNLVRHR